uniref:Diacylglycerol O-acyltransferase n=1 Tax=Peronospora matthiolae TaxID=2874970 RepID=A0AAV1U5T2_9STRA
MDVETSDVLTRVAANGLSLRDDPFLLTAVVLVVVLSVVVFTLSQQQQRSAVDDSKQCRRTRRLSNIGLSTLVTEVPSNLSIPVSVLTVEGRLQKQDFVERLRLRLLHDPFFLRWRSVVRGEFQTGVFKFVELLDYDVVQNIVAHTIQEGEGETTMSYIESVLVNTPLDFDKPLWEMHVIYDPINEPNVTTIGWKVHHCLGDGASLATAMAKLSDQSAVFDEMLQKREQALKDTRHKKRSRPWSQTLQGVVVFSKVCIWSLYVFSLHMTALIARPEPRTAFKRLGGKHKRLSYNMLYSVSTTKAVGKQFRATVNDVMLNVVAGAMRKTILAMGESVAPTLKVRCAIPVDMRSSTEIIRHTSNRFSSLVIDLPVGIEDPAERLLKITAAMSGAKNSLEKYFVYWSSHLLSMLPAPIMRWIVHFTTSRISVAVTNVRASVEEVSLCNRQVTGFFGFVPPPPYVNLGVAILSMGDNLGLNVLVDVSVGITGEQFLDYANEEYNALKESVIAEEADGGSECKKTK